jgi:hypothetical protein
MSSVSFEDKDDEEAVMGQVRRKHKSDGAGAEEAQQEWEMNLSHSCTILKSPTGPCP